MEGAFREEWDAFLLLFAVNVIELSRTDAVYWLLLIVTLFLLIRFS